MKLLLLFLLGLFAVSSVEAHNDKVLLKGVQVLTFQKGKMTTGRRSAPVQQMLCTNCLGEQSRDAVTSIQCKNIGFDGRDVNWKCKAKLSKQWLLGVTSVSCEGYDHPDDRYVLTGSCGVEYELKKNPSYVPPPAPPTHVKPPTQNNPSRISSETATSIALCVITMFTLGFIIFVLSYPTTHTLERTFTVVPETRSTVTQTTSYPTTAPVYHSSSATPPVMTTTHVEHHHHTPSQPGYSDGLVTGMMVGTMSQPVRPQTVIVQPSPTVVVQRPTPPEPVIVERYIQQDSSSDAGATHTSTSHATTKRR